MAALDKGIARRVKQAVERFAETGAGNVKKLQGIDPPEYRLRVGDYRVRFELDGETHSRSPRAQPPRSLPLKFFPARAARSTLSSSLRTDTGQTPNNNRTNTERIVTRARPRNLSRRLRDGVLQDTNVAPETQPRTGVTCHPFSRCEASSPVPNSANAQGEPRRRTVTFFDTHQRGFAAG